LSGLTINLGNTTISSGGSNNMIVGNAIIGYAGALTGYTSPTVGNLYAGYLTTSNNTSIGNSSARANLAVSGNLTVDDTAAATSTTSGAFQVKGGVGIGGNIYVGGAQANITGNVLIEGTEANISTGNLRIGGNANVVHDMVIGGNLTVSGTTTYVNTTNSSLTDPLIDIAGNGSGGDLTGGDLYDRGLYIHNYAGGAAVNQFMGWKQGDGEFQLKTGVSTSGNAVTGGTYANLRLDTLYTDHLYGTVETVDQPNIANMSGLFDISVSNLADINLAQVTTLVASGLNYPLNDGSAPQDNEVVVLRTDGAANLTFEIIHTDRIGNATSGIFVNADGNVEVTANSNLTFTVTETGANVVGDFDVTGLLSAGSLNVGSLTPESITIGDTNIDDSTVTTHDDQQHVVAEVPAVAGNAVEFFVKGKSVVGGVTYATVATVTAMYDGTNVDFATYGKLHMPSGGTGAGSLTVNYGGGNIQLLATPSQNADTLWTAQIRTI
jgi:hypothetical protein